MYSHDTRSHFLSISAFGFWGRVLTLAIYKLLETMMRSVEDEKRADEERTSLLIKKNTNNNDGNPENNT